MHTEPLRGEMAHFKEEVKTVVQPATLFLAQIALALVGLVYVIYDAIRSRYSHLSASIPCLVIFYCLGGIRLFGEDENSVELNLTLIVAALIATNVLAVTLSKERRKV